jgi:hypothetical protein
MVWATFWANFSQTHLVTLTERVNAAKSLADCPEQSGNAERPSLLSGDKTNLSSAETIYGNRAEARKKPG